MKKQKQPRRRKPYAGSVLGKASEPYAFTDSIEREAHLLPILFDYYRISPDDPQHWRKLALTLARIHVDAFKEKPYRERPKLKQLLRCESKASRRKLFGENLLRDVEAQFERAGLQPWKHGSVRTALRLIFKNMGKRCSVKTLERYEKLVSKARHSIS